MTGAAGISQVGRLPGRAFDAVFQEGKRVNHPMVTLICRQRPDPAGASSAVRLGVVVAKTVARSAVMRNRLRRILRDSFRLQSEPVADRRMDCVLLARPATRSVAKRQEIDPVILKLIKKLEARS